MATFFLILIYFAFISLGLPDSLLGVSWPVMQPGFNVPYSFAGIGSMVIAGGTIVSSLLSGHVIHRFGTGRVTFVSVMMTAAALLGFSLAPSFAWIVLLAVPLGLGGGAVDAALNGYVAEHYKARHMSWLHSFWGVGAMVGPLIMSQMIARDQSWRSGYLVVSIIQWVLVAVLFFSLPLWKRAAGAAQGAVAGDAEQKDAGHAQPAKGAPKSLASLVQIYGVKFALVAFLFYCGIESTMGLWGSSYLVRVRGLDVATAAQWVSFYYGSITIGRMIAGFVTMKVSSKMLIRTGGLMILSGVLLLFLPLPAPFAMVGFILIGLGCAPVFPSMLHETPVRFGKESAQQVMGLQMASAYIGTTFLPPIFGFIASNTSMVLFPIFVLVYIAAMLASTERLNVAMAGLAKGSQHNKAPAD